MRGSYFKMRFAYGLKLLAPGGCSSLLREPPSADQPPAPFKGLTDIRYASAPQELPREGMIREYDLDHKMTVGGIPWRRLPPECRE